MRSSDPWVSRTFGLLTGGACAMAVMVLMYFRADSLRWAEAQFGVDLSWAFVPILSVSIAVAGIVATWEICRLRRHQRSL